MKKQWAMMMIAMSVVSGLAIRAPAQCTCHPEEALSVQRFVQERAQQRAAGVRPVQFRDPRAPRFQMAPFVQKPQMTQKAVCPPGARAVCVPAAKGSACDPCGYCRTARLGDIIRRLDFALQTILPGRRFCDTSPCGVYEGHKKPNYAYEVYPQPVAPRSPLPSRTVPPPAPVPPPTAPPADLPAIDPPPMSPPPVEKPLPNDDPFRDDTLELEPPAEEPQGEADRGDRVRMSRFAVQERQSAVHVRPLVRPVTVDQPTGPQEPAVQQAAYWNQPVIRAESD